MATEAAPAHQVPPEPASTAPDGSGGDQGTATAIGTGASEGDRSNGATDREDRVGDGDAGGAADGDAVGAADGDAGGAAVDGDAGGAAVDADAGAAVDDAHGAPTMPTADIPEVSHRRRPIPIRTMLAVVGSVLAAAAVVEVLLKLRQVVVWTAVAALLATVLHPPVNLLVRKLKMARALAALLVFLAGTALVVGLGYAFVRPLAHQINVAVNDFPGYVKDAQAGKGTIGHLVKKYNIDTWVEKNQPKLQSALKSAEKPLVKVATGLLNTLTAAATIIVMTFLLLLEGPRMMQGGLAVLSPPTQAKFKLVIRDLVRAVAGYVGGVLAGSIIAGLVSYVTLWILGVPFRGVLAVWIGFTALVPLVGIFLGVIPAAAVAFIHSTPAGFAVIVVVLGFALIENRTLGKLINTRTIDLSPLAVAVSVLAGFQLLGFLGVFLAIPAAGVIHVVVRDIWIFRHPTPSAAAALALTVDPAAATDPTES